MIGTIAYMAPEQAMGRRNAINVGTDVWALGDCAAVPNAATPGQLDPPTSQHALRQGRRLKRQAV